MLLYSGRHAVVHPCKTFAMCCLWSVGEGTIFKMRFFLTYANIRIPDLDWHREFQTDGPVTKKPVGRTCSAGIVGQRADRRRRPAGT